MEEVSTFFRPEFLNRLDDIVMFNPLSKQDLQQIMQLKVKTEVELASEQGLFIKLSADAIKWLVDKNDQPQYGARPLRRILQKYLREPLADYLISTNPPKGTTMLVEVSDSKIAELNFRVVEIQV